MTGTGVAALIVCIVLIVVAYMLIAAYFAAKTEKYAVAHCTRRFHGSNCGHLATGVIIGALWPVSWIIPVVHAAYRLGRK